MRMLIQLHGLTAAQALETVAIAAERSGGPVDYVSRDTARANRIDQLTPRAREELIAWFRQPAPPSDAAPRTANTAVKKARSHKRRTPVKAAP